METITVTYFTHRSGIFIVDFELVNAGWFLFSDVNENIIPFFASFLQ